MGVTITKRPKMPRFDGHQAAKIIKAFAVGAILERMGRGESSKGGAFASYSPRYREILAAGGEDLKVDLRLTGGLANSIKARETLVERDGVTVTIAPDTGTSPQVAPTLTRAKVAKATRQHNRRVAKGADVDESLARLDKATTGKMRRTGRRSPPHNVLGAYIHFGAADMPARPFLELSPSETEELVRLLRAAGVFGV